MHRGMMKPPGFPFFPFLFPIGIALSLLGLTAYSSYQSWRELHAIRQVEESARTRS